MKKAVIFDLDGTLADSLESIAYCTNKTLQGLGLDPIEKDTYRYLVGDGAAKLVERALLLRGDSELKLFDKALEDYTQIFEQYCMYHVRPYNGIVESLQELKQRGVRLAVLSNKPHLRTLDVIKSLFKEGVFDVVAGQKEGIEKKPSPEGVFAILEELQMTPQDVIYLGDTNTDMKTGKASGAFTVGVLWGFRDRKELEENHADDIIEKPEEILKYF